MKQFKLTLVLTILMSMAGLQAFADWDRFTKIHEGDLYYYLDKDNLQAQVTSMPSGKYTGDIMIPTTFTYNETNYSVTEIGSSAFYNCSALTSVTIGNSVTSIGSDAFSWCSGLTSVTALNPTPVAIITEYVFTNRTNATLYVPKGSKSAYQAAAYWKEFKEIVEIDVTGIKAVENEQIAGSDETGNWYTLDGRRLSGKPTKRGIYIVNGRKVIVN